jgi:HD-GYP domain-containing protein (c-di-GMP phosphodiesterase class II)
MGGDEFCVLFTRVEGDAAVQAAEAGAALRMGSRGFSVDAAVGLVLLPDEADNASDALRLADQRMYENKATGRMASGRQVTEALARALMERDPRLGDHGGEVSRIAGDVAAKLGLPAAERERVKLAAELHDVGKIAIPDQILSKPGRLDEQEWDLMRKHTLIGQRILEAAPALRDIGPIVRSSHERVDGGGYPDGLAGAEIPTAARIVAACDAYHAMVSRRPYREPLSREAALAELDRHAGTQFDPLVVEALGEVLEESGERSGLGHEALGLAQHERDGAEHLGTLS